MFSRLSERVAMARLSSLARGVRQANLTYLSPAKLAALEEAALRYLNRFDATAKKLSDHLLKAAKRRGAAEQVREIVVALVARYRESGLIDDRRYARLRSERLRERGASRRLIAAKLRAQGVASEIIDDVLGTAPSESELDAARAYVRRKRLGRFRPLERQQEERRKDLGRLARQGFDFDTAVRALGLGSEDDF